MRRWSGMFVLSLALAGCDKPGSPDSLQGYAEGEYVYVAAALPGKLEDLLVERGAEVKQGALLFKLEDVLETAARDEAKRRLDQATASLEDAKKGKRPEEIESLDAMLKQARAAAVLAENELSRQQQLLGSGASSKQELDRAVSTRDQARERVTQLEADLRTAKLGSRSDQIASIEANVHALEAALAQAEWNLAQKRQFAPKSGLVFDTLYREGEWVVAGRPIVALLPPENIKVRTFVPETRIAELHTGDSVQVRADGVSSPFLGKISYISPQAEYTPPVIYSRENRAKLVFMVEVVFPPETAAKLHPGQPVDVSFD